MLHHKFVGEPQEYFVYFKFFQQTCRVKELPKTYDAIVRCCLKKSRETRFLSDFHDFFVGLTFRKFYFEAAPFL